MSIIYTVISRKAFTSNEYGETVPEDTYLVEYT